MGGYVGGGIAQEGGETVRVGATDSNVQGFEGSIERDEGSDVSMCGWQMRGGQRDEGFVRGGAGSRGRGSRGRGRGVARRQTRLTSFFAII